jgi:hypothetical protein
VNSSEAFMQLSDAGRAAPDIAGPSPGKGNRNEAGSPGLAPPRHPAYNHAFPAIATSHPPILSPASGLHEKNSPDRR